MISFGKSNPLKRVHDMLAEVLVWVGLMLLALGGVIFVSIPYWLPFVVVGLMLKWLLG